MKRHQLQPDDPTRLFPSNNRPWRRKWFDAFHGLCQATYRQSSFYVHFFAAVAVIAAAWFLGTFDTVRWALLVLCITMVIGCEMLNTSIETLAKAITSTHDPLVGRALDIAGGAVLVFSFGAAVVGTILFLESLTLLFYSSTSTT